MNERRIKRIINFFVEKRINFYAHKKTAKILKALSLENEDQISTEVIEEYKNNWRQLSSSGKISNQFLLMYSSISGIVSPDYVPENIYYNKIEPILNNRLYVQAYADKNIYELLHKDPGIFPQILLRKINGVYYDPFYKPIVVDDQLLANLLRNHDKIIVKPSTETGGGSLVRLYINEAGRFRNNDEILNTRDLDLKYPHNLIIQSYLEAHPFYKRFNPSSLNTVRIFTYRSPKTENVISLSAVLRIGRPGSIVDNQAAGGIAVGITSDGKLNGFAVDKMGNKYYSQNGLDFEGIGNLLLFDEMKKLAQEIAARLFYNRLAGFDFCVDAESRVRLLEINCKNIEINFLQMTNGPLFQEHTAEVISFCKHQPKTINLDFYV